MFRTKTTIINNILRIRDEGERIHEQKFNCILKSYCISFNINIDPLTQQPRDYFPHRSALTKDEWKKLERAYVWAYQQINYYYC